MSVPPPTVRAHRLAWALVIGIGIGAVSSRHMASADYCDTASAATVTVSDPTPGAQPDVTFTYTVNTARGDYDVLFWAFNPAGVTFSDRTGAQVAAQATVKVNDVTRTPGIVWTGNSMVMSSLLLINLDTGYSLSVGDKVEVTFPSGIITNPSSATDITWVWRTSTSGGYDEECYTHTLSIATTTTSTTSTTTSTTSTTEPSTTSVAIGTTSTIATGTSSTVPVDSTLVTTSGTDVPPLAASDAPDQGDLTSTGGRSDLWTLLAIALVLIGIVATNGRIVRHEP